MSEAEEELRKKLIDRGPRFSVELGQLETPVDLITSLDMAGVKYDDRASTIDVIHHIELTQDQGSAKSCPVTPADLGNNEVTPRIDFYNQSEAIGFYDIVQEYLALLALKCARQLQESDGIECDLAISDKYISGSQPISIADKYSGSQHIIVTENLDHILFVDRRTDGIYLYWDFDVPDEEAFVVDAQFLRSYE